MWKKAQIPGDLKVLFFFSVQDKITKGQMMF